MAVCPTPNLIQNAQSKRAGDAAARKAQLKTGADSRWGETIFMGAPSFSPYHVY